MWCKLRRKSCQGVISFCLVIGVSNLIRVIGIVVLKEIPVNLLCHDRSNLHRSGFGSDNSSGKVGFVRFARACREGITDLALKISDKVLVTLACDNSQDVHVMDGRRVVHAIAMLVDTNPQSPANFLAARDRVVAVLEHTHNEDIGVVPAFPQGRMGENEPDRLRKGEQPFLVLQDQIVGIHVIGKPCVFSSHLEARIGEPLCLLVDGEVAVVGTTDGNTFQIFLKPSSI